MTTPAKMPTAREFVEARVAPFALHGERAIIEFIEARDAQHAAQPRVSRATRDAVAKAMLGNYPRGSWGDLADVAARLIDVQWPVENDPNKPKETTMSTTTGTHTPPLSTTDAQPKCPATGVPLPESEVKSLRAKLAGEIAVNGEPMKPEPSVSPSLVGTNPAATALVPESGAKTHWEQADTSAPPASDEEAEKIGKRLAYVARSDGVTWVEIGRAAIAEVRKPVDPVEAAKVSRAEAIRLSPDRRIRTWDEIDEETRAKEIAIETAVLKWARVPIAEPKPKADIVTRLRGTVDIAPTALAALLDEAAAEIERLRKEPK